ncbi:SDR family oxidoreductase [Lentzea sp. NPDC058436]|uniref:SDR family oxidoreductase n=1 Tax=Lentzea sp. NPDC058436 TaxID=3346499 RepID=UPI0036472E5C
MNNNTKTVLVTGASSGLGRATAEHFHAQGWNVVATMRTPEGDHGLTPSDRMLVTRLDVQDTGSIRSAVAASIQRFGRIDVLVNNAGYGAYGPLEAMSPEEVRRQFDVNVLGLIATTQAVLPHFRANRSGCVVNVSSIGGRIAFPLGSLYHATKFAVEGFSEALRYELAEIGVAVKVVEPGGMKTDFGGRSLAVVNDEGLGEYQPLFRKVLDVLGPLVAAGSAPELAAEVVYTAATDGTSRLRYEAGPDAVQFLEARRSSDDATFFAGVEAQFSPDR